MSLGDCKSWQLGRCLATGQVEVEAAACDGSVGSNVASVPRLPQVTVSYVKVRKDKRLHYNTKWDRICRWVSAVLQPAAAARLRPVAWIFQHSRSS